MVIQGKKSFHIAFPFKELSRGFSSKELSSFDNESTSLNCTGESKQRVPKHLHSAKHCFGLEDLWLHTRGTNNRASSPGIFPIPFASSRYHFLIGFPSKQNKTKNQTSHFKATVHHTPGSLGQSSLNAAVLINCEDLGMLSHEVVNPRSPSTRAES